MEMSTTRHDDDNAMEASCVTDIDLHRATDSAILEREARIVDIGIRHGFNENPCPALGSDGSGKLKCGHRSNDDDRQPGPQFQGGSRYNAEDSDKFRRWLIREGWSNDG